MDNESCENTARVEFSGYVTCRKTKGHADKHGDSVTLEAVW